MKASTFKDLRAYQLASDLADDMRAEALRWPKFDMWTTGLQLVRAADSVAANIAEASGRWKDADQRRFLHIARASLYETEHWITRSQTRGLLRPGIDERLTEIAKTLNGLIARSNRRLRQL